jgi:hypothetical protein
LSIFSKLSEAFKSLTSNQANADVSAGGDVPSTDQAAVPRPDREPQVGFEPERDS